MRPIDIKNAAAPTPPMGWNSWDCYMSAVTEQELLDNAEYMAKNLLKYGWHYIVCDIQWSEPNAGSQSGVEYRPFAKLCMDEYGRLIPAPNRFPSSEGGLGFKPIADKIHSLGLKFGIHIMRGIPRQAVYSRCRLYGSKKTVDIAAQPNSICPWNGDMFGAANNGYAQMYYDSIFELYASWGVDFVKVDDIAAMGVPNSGSYLAAHEIEMIRHAIDKSGRKMVLSLSPGPADVNKAWHLKQNANMWRMTNDFWDDWNLLKGMFERCEVWETHVGAGCWPDCDMLPIGKIGIKFGNPRQSSFTYEETKTMLTLWSIFRSPLILGGELTSLDDTNLKLLQNEAVLRLNAHSFNARQIFRDENKAAWLSNDEDGSNYVALFNLSDSYSKVGIHLSEFEAAGVEAQELWTGEEVFTNSYLADDIPPHGCRLYKVKKL